MLWIVICFEIVLTVPLIYKNGSVLKKMMQYTIINLLIWYFAHMIEPGRRINTIFVIVMKSEDLPTIWQMWELTKFSLS